MTIPEYSEDLLSESSDTTVLTTSEWLMCLSEYVKTCFPVIPKVVLGYTYHSDFYKNAKSVANWLNNLRFVQEPDTTFRMERNTIYISDEPPVNIEVLKRELFYTWKNEHNYLDLTPSTVYFITLAYKQEQIPFTCIPAVLPEYVTKDLQSKVMGEPFEVISTLTHEQFTPITDDTPYIERDNFLEVYIKQLDCVIYTNKDFFDKISFAQLEDIYMEDGYLSLGDKYLHEHLDLDGVFVGAMGKLDLVNCR